MNITSKTGNILTPVDPINKVIVCHQVNCQGAMGAGLAKQIRTKHPGVYEVYKEKCDAGLAKIGDVQLVSCLSDGGYIIANIFGQNRYGRDKRYTDYDGLREAFSCLADCFPNATFRFPYKFGCGLAGGDWNVVLKIIKESFKDCKVEIWRLPDIKN